MTRYWQSPAELRCDPTDREAGELRQQEFPEELPVGPAKASFMPVAAGATGEVSRRGFLELMGFSLAAAGCSRAPVREAVPFVDKPEELTPGVPLDYATACAGCTAGCGLLVRTRDGRPIKIEGNPLSFAGGGTCAVGQASVLGLYDQGRAKGPLWQGQPVSWDELDARVVERLRAIAAGGRRMAVVTGAVSSPATSRLLGDLLAHYPTARWLSYEPVSNAALRRAHAAAYDRAVVPRYRFDRARVVVGLEADFLGTWLSPVAFTRGYAAGRRLARHHGEMSWHGQFESGLSVSGANADLRVPVNAAEVGGVALGLWTRLAERSGIDTAGVATPAVAIDAAHLEETVERLWAARGDSLVVAGVNDPEVQTVVAAINDLLGNVGATVELPPAPARVPSDEGELVRLVEEMQRGEIHALLLWGVNPVYDTPLGDAFRQAMAHVALKVAFNDRRDETAFHCDALCPDHHPLEAWNDVAAVPGERGLAQPTLAPLHDTRAAQTSLLRFMGRSEAWYDVLRQTWREEVFPHSGVDSFDQFWNRAVHDGVARLAAEPEAVPFIGDAHAAAAAVGGRVAEAARRGDGQLDLRLYEKVAVRDGRHANNPWLQEMPDPITRAGWSNYAAVSPQIADRLGLADGDVVTLKLDGSELELPVLIQPGQAADTVAVALGYGRSRSGPVGDGVGGSAYPLVRLEDGLFRYAATGLELAPTGRHEEIPTSQKHHSMEGRPIVRETTLAAWRDDPAAGNHEHHAIVSLWPERPFEGNSWGLSIDLNACVGCSACVIACQAENNVPVVGREEFGRGRGMHWIRLDRYYHGGVEDPDTVFQPMMCQHCANAPCETVCPVLATVHSSDGLNQQVYNRCVGTRYCANNCPYKVRRFNWFNYAHNDRFDYHMNDQLGTLVLNPDVTVRSRGVMEKCSMCVQRIQAGKLRAKIEGRATRDGDIETACQQACPAEAITFGDWNDPASRLAGQGEDERFYHVLAELNTRPNVGYLTKVRHRDGAGHPDDTVHPAEEKA